MTAHISPTLRPSFSADLSRLPMVGLLCAAALLLGVALAWAQAPVTTASKTAEGAGSDSSGGKAADSLSSGPSEPSARTAADRQIREGTEIVDLPGFFKLTGDRAAFFTPDGKRQFVGLENLNLERVVRILNDNPEPLQWQITGTITEYCGTNFLFVRRAVLKSRLPSRGNSSPEHHPEQPPSK